LKGKQSSLDAFVSCGTTSSSRASTQLSVNSAAAKETIQIDDSEDDDEQQLKRPYKRQKDNDDDLLDTEERALCDIEPKIKRKLPLSAVNDNKRNKPANTDVKLDQAKIARSKENVSKIPV